MKYAILILLLGLMLISFFQSTVFALNITKIVDNGTPESHIDLVIIGSGFSVNEMIAFIDKVDQNINEMFKVDWFADNQQLFNIWRVEAVSPQSGVDLSDAQIFAIADPIPHDVLIILHNYDGQEAANKYVELYKYSHNYVVLAHELGHMIGKLADEYWTPKLAHKCNGLSKMTPNTHDKPTNEKWSGLISNEPIEGGRFCEKGLWRPTENSIMRDSANTKFFNAVGYRAMDLGAGKILGTIESTPPSINISGVKNGEMKNGTIHVKALTNDLSGVERVEFYWAKAGDTSKSIKIDRTRPYDLMIDTAQYDNGRYYLDTLSYDRNWNYSRKTTQFNISN